VRRLLVFATALPVLAALGEDAGEQGFARFNFAFLISGPGEFSFGGTRAAFAGGFEHGGAVAFEVGLHPAQRRPPRLQTRNCFFNLCHNPPLFGKWSGWKLDFAQYMPLTFGPWTRMPPLAAFNLNASNPGFEKMPRDTASPHPPKRERESSKMRRPLRDIRQ